MPDNSLKIYPPTPQQQERLRKQGVVPKSREVVSLASLTVALLALRWSLEPLLHGANGAIVEAASRLKDAPTLTSYENVGALLLHFAGPMVVPLITIMMLVALAIVGANVAQFGIMLNFSVVSPKLSRLDPVKGMGRIFGKQGMVELIKNIAKVGLVGAVLVTVLLAHQQDIGVIATQEVAASGALISSVAFEIAWKILGSFLIVAGADYVYQRKKYGEQSKMSRTEHVQDLKDLMGDPQIKQRLATVRRELLKQKHEKEVPTATAVVTNPTHVAVALRYDPLVRDVPWVVAKGTGVAAERIKKIAREAGVPVIEQPPLARALYKYVQVGGAVPPIGDLWQLVSVLLKKIYELYPERMPSQMHK